jgi:2-dehydro-3-deoxygalactonokinase
LIGIDWGTSNFRAFRFDEAGVVIDKRSYPGGILQVQEGRFEEMLRAQVGDWLGAGETRLLLSGMIGSRQGWMETSYVSCPVTVVDLANAALRLPFPGAVIFIIPGVLGADPQEIPEVMRGEETQVMGMLESSASAGLVCLPGTHSKWIQCNDEAIVSFTTAMTGDVFAALRKATILGRIMSSSDAVDDEAFLRGVARSADPGGLLHHLFGVRALALTGQLTEDASASYLSGLLIGHEVRAAMLPAAHVHLVGAATLCTLYARAIQSCGGSFTLEEEDAAARGLAAIGRRLSWI